MQTSIKKARRKIFWVEERHFRKRDKRLEERVLGGREREKKR